MLNYAEKLVTLKCKCYFEYEDLEKIRDTVIKLTSGRITTLRCEIQKVLIYDIFMHSNIHKI